MATPESVLGFWLDEVGEGGWYTPPADLDDRVRTRFEPAWKAACAGKYALWLTYPTGALAYILLVDQFPRNMFRGHSDAFATDPQGLAAAKAAIDRKWDMRIDVPARQFFYLPLMHSENLSDQDRCVRLFCERMPDSDSNLLHARAHREVIRRFGRFPYRNAALGRITTGPEETFLAQGGYAMILSELEAEHAA